MTISSSGKFILDEMPERALGAGAAVPLAEALDGESLPPIRSAWPLHEEDEIEAASDVLRSGRVNALQHGDHCRAFEAEFAAFCEAPHALTLANGTLALELALRAVGVRPGDEVVVTPRSFVASASCIANCGARPVFADVDPDTQLITAGTVEPVLTARTRAIVAVHLAGRPCEMDALRALAEPRGIALVEDCAQAHGARYKGRPVGGLGDAGVFSFCTDKIMSTGGEGGMMVTPREDVWRRAWAYKDHGKDYDLFRRPAGGNAFRYIVNSIGSNFRMTEMQAAIGRRQLGKLGRWHAARAERADILTRMLGDVPGLRVPAVPGHLTHAWYKFYAFARPERLAPGWTRDRIINAASRAGVPCQSGSCSEIYREKAFRDLVGPDQPVLPHARALGQTSILLPVDPTLSLTDVVRMGGVLREIAEAASGAQG
ncbi:DegT/DnrJ/EryC1/StrS family aminotransferase [Parvularcula oceani]|uniref:DegT/DnrJ/EryC1/StrS family aminotransferase n=1 Tax=Parvularcula oceani TaxID=1247963 RepID=UPI000A774C00|nr:DegT/DnrJ/EryC1/StrS family aminotransferase [Parvularcula oceani]